ncbi:MAG: sigma-70 family RNA polymerase sigma factor [Caldilineaceae bacterium SB0661_bin_32]|uniref:Sigma-70 family RNA polymerase sigma factor n=1 Tax=Caldilineaceae bacterium SB0661_bin_32 TaxID=2605255 RepID=A0A6B1D4C6_9CHLR|nr:sigma-70 family RNA polymerase sigma factor [Caldilineaceae bacterium SB0661_bin_32]
MNEQEQDWLDRARAGEQEAFGFLVETYQRPVFALAYRMLGDLSEAEDAAQETFLRAYARLDQYDPGRKFSTWLFSIANYHCIDRLRKRRVQFVGLDESPVVFTLESDSARPEEETLAVEQAEEMQALVNQLEPEYRTPLVLRYWNDCSYQEIADVMDISVPAVKSRLFRARKKLAELYETAQQTHRVEGARASAGLSGQIQAAQNAEANQPPARFESAGPAEKPEEGWTAQTLLLHRALISGASL